MRFVVAALLALLAFAPAAGAQGGATVARHGDVELLVRDDTEDGDDDSLCVELRNGESDMAGSCAPAPTSRMSALLVGSSNGSRSFMGGAVPAAGTFEVEVEFARGERVRARTVSGAAYTGASAGKLAFFLAETTGAQRPYSDEPDDEPVLIRRFDASGNLIGAAAGGDGSGTRVAGPQTVARLGGITVTAASVRSFAPSVIQLDRTETSVCLSYRRADGGDGGSGTCAGSGPSLPVLEVVSQRECGRGLLLHGFTGPQVATVELTLGDGRRRRAGTIDLGALGTAARAVATLVPPGQAIRSVRALDAAGRVVDRQRVAAAPAPRRCGSGLNGWVAFYESHVTPARGGAAAQVVAGTAPGPLLVARDDGDHLCLGIDDLSSEDHACLVPPPEGDFPVLVDRKTRDYSAAGGLLPHGAASVRVVFEGGERVTAEVSDGGAYAGRYRGHVRFYLARAGGNRDVVSVETYDAAGKLLSAIPGAGGPGTSPRTIARGPGYRVVASRYDYRLKYPGERPVRVRGTCFSLAFGGRPSNPHECVDLEHGFAGGGVSCSPRRGAVIGAMRKGSRGARFELAGGGTITSRTIRVPRRFGGGRLWVLEIPPRARVLRLRLLGRLGAGVFSPLEKRVRPYPVPQPRRQCGYDFDVTF